MKSLTSSDYLAHSANRAGDLQSLEAHLNGVAKKAAQFAEKFEAGEEGYATGLIHDIGKLRDEFQDYLRSERSKDSETHHAPYGAALAFRRDWPSCFAVAGHHSGLPNLSHLQTLVSDESRYNIEARLQEIEHRFRTIIGELPNDISRPPFLQEGNPSPLALEFYIRMIFSCLVDADYLDTEEHFLGKPRSTVRLVEVCETLCVRLAEEREGKPKDGPVNEIRHRIFDQCVRAAVEKPGFYSLTVPTGGGKTLSSMAFALAHARKWHLERVIVVIPYLSIIEQNAAEYRRILDPNDDGIVLEHHSAVSTAGEEEDKESSPAQLAAENWDAPIVVTTSVQLIESLFAASPSKCRKLHNIARSVVIMDEVQTLPFHLLEPLLSVLRELTSHYGTTFLFMTATQPGFRQDSLNLKQGFRPGEVNEITEHTHKLFDALRRVEFKHVEKLGWLDLTSRMAAYDQVLTVVNVRKHAFALWSALQQTLGDEELDSLFHLSSAMCAEHRLWTLGEIENPRMGSIRDRLKRGLPCRVVSTQVVEAGVDLDFPAVFRAMGPLDSIVQAAGRCNREGRLGTDKGGRQLGEVFVFTPDEHILPPGIYRTATELTGILLGRKDSLDTLGTRPEVFGDYFSELVQLAHTDYVRGQASSIQEDRSELRFRDVARKARVIEDEGVPVIVPYGAALDQIEQIREHAGLGTGEHFNYSQLRSLQRFMVNLRTADQRKALQFGIITRLVPDMDIWVTEEGCYNDHLGLLIEERPTEDFVL